MLVKLLDENYKQIYKSSLAMTKDTDLANDLVSETLLTLHRRETIVPHQSNEFVLYFCKCMYINLISKRSSYKKATKCKEVLIENSYLCNIDSGTEIDVDDKGPDIMDQVTEFKNGLNELERLLFELHFENRMSYRMIAKMYSKKLNYVLTTQGIYTLMKPLNQKIRLNKWKL